MKTDQSINNQKAKLQKAIDDKGREIIKANGDKRHDLELENLELNRRYNSL